ncbi:hypothetical protein VE03_06445 [Pseudogymnoascus sp. 23342-1-I1]|nr:hypothetical protein VE03_06445 [Pseudogymnoascus sp. 23342-1-I1]
MTNVEAQSIIKELAQLEFPIIFKISLQFALFKTYGIPTISDLLVATRMFSTPETASKRYEDTSVLIGEYLAHDPREERALKAIARMNYLHSPYVKSGKISNDDLLYTLSVFVSEPISWVGRFEWRRLTDLEICALATFWKSIGDAMEIDYAGRLKRSTWKDGIEFYEDLAEWAQLYEAKYMVPVASNKKTADELVPLLLFYVPRPLVPFSTQVIGVLMGERLRWAMMYPEPSLVVYAITYTILFLRRFVLRYLTFPRIFPLVEFSKKDPKTGRYHHNNYQVHPYYVKPTFLNRWGATAWVTWMLGGILPGGKDGEKYYPQGYVMNEVGPDRKRGVGKEALEIWEEKIQHSRPSGCPFAMGL